MTRDQAMEMAEKFRATDKFTKVRVVPCSSPGNSWEIDLWSGDHGETTIRDYEPDAVPSLVRRALGRATERDKELMLRQIVARQIDEQC